MEIYITFYMISLVGLLGCHSHSNEHDSFHHLGSDHQLSNFDYNNFDLQRLFFGPSNSVIEFFNTVFDILSTDNIIGKLDMNVKNTGARNRVTRNTNNTVRTNTSELPGNTNSSDAKPTLYNYATENKTQPHTNRAMVMNTTLGTPTRANITNFRQNVTASTGSIFSSNHVTESQTQPHTIIAVVMNATTSSAVYPSVAAFLAKNSSVYSNKHQNNNTSDVLFSWFVRYSGNVYIIAAFILFTIVVPFLGGMCFVVSKIQQFINSRHSNNQYQQELLEV